MKNSDLYVELYKQLEQLATGRYNYPDDGKAVYNLSLRKEFASIKTDLDYCRAVRAVLVHKPKISRSFPIEPCDEMIALLRSTIEKVKNPPKAKDIAIPFGSILYKSMNDLVLPTMMEMQEKVYTHIPILQDGVVVGVFSENTVFSYLADEQIVEIAQNMRFSDLASYLPIEKHRAESFRFIGQTKLISEIRGIFEDALSRQDRIGLMFITKSVNPKEPLLGILTAWDVAAVQ